MLHRGLWPSPLRSSRRRARKGRIDAETAELETRLSDQTVKLKECKELVARTLKLARNCRKSYAKGSPETKRLWNQAFFEKIVVKDREVVRHTVAEPFRSVLDVSNENNLVALSGRFSNHEFRREVRAVYQGR